MPQFQELIDEDVKSNNLQHIIQRFAAWLAKFNMPRFYNENFEAQATTTVVAYTEAGTKRKYIKQLKAILKDKFPKHPDWSNQAEWWTQLLNNFDTEAKRNKIKSHSSNDSDWSVRCLYKRNMLGKVPMGCDMDLFQSMEEVDLTYICQEVAMIYVSFILFIFVSLLTFVLFRCSS